MGLARTPRGNFVYEPDGEVLEEYLHDRSELVVVQGPIGCLSADTEVLTPDGWVFISDWGGEEIAVWDGVDLRMEHPLRYVDLPCSEMWHFSTDRSLSMVVSDEHRIPVFGRDGRFRVRVASDVAAAVGRNRVPTAFRRVGDDADENGLRLHVAICADGCLPKAGNQVVICVRKERKKVRLRELLTACKIEWKEFPHSTRPDELTFAFRREAWMTKRLALWGLSSAGLRVVLDEVAHWDGLFEGPDCRFDTTDKEAADFIQYAAHASGGKATLSSRDDKRSADWATLYSVHIAKPGSRKASVWMRVDGTKVKRVKTPDGRKYCFTTSTGYFLARHNGCIFITGNSGTSTCSCHRIWKLACEQACDFDGVRRTRWLIVRSSYRQLKKTTIKTWLEWFPENTWGDMIRSEPMTHVLKRAHPSGDGTTVLCEVIFLAIDSPETAEQEAASFEITGFWVNEGQFVEKEVIDELLSRCGRYPSKKNGPGASWHGGMIDLNAPSEGHWIPYMRGDIPAPSEWTDEEKEMMRIPTHADGRPAWRFLVQPAGLIEVKDADGNRAYQPNPKAENQKHLKKSYMEQIRGKRKEWIDQRVMNRVGLYVGGKAVYPTFSQSDHVHARNMDAVQGFPIILGLDFGRDPAAAFLQCVNGQWSTLAELIGDNESAMLFAPRVKRMLATEFPGFDFEAWGDPRGADKGQNDETTAYDIFQSEGITVFPATSDNNPEMRRSTVESVLARRNGLRINPKCLTLRTGMAGGYHYKKIQGTAGLYSPRPVKNRYSHIVEALENGLMGGGEGYAITTRAAQKRATPSKPHRSSIRARA